MKDRVPASPSRLIGRERELSELRALLAEGVRLVTLTGAGGSGKTRLGLALAESVAEEFASSAFVDLAGLRDPSLVPQTIAAALEAPRGTARTPFEAIARHIGTDRLLLVLDNFEQLLPESAVVSDLLTTCPSLVVIATSRAPLELRWERVYPVGPLEVPGAGPLSVGALRRSPSVSLFCERVRAVRPLFSLDEQNARAIADIVRRLDGLPLAIELVAARARVLSAAEIATRLGSVLDLLGEAERDRPARQRTMRATIDWSLALLTDAQRRTVRRLSVFDGGATLDAISEVCADPGERDLLRDVEDLVQAGVAATAEAAGETRIRLPATVRERAQELLAEGEASAVADSHARYFAALTQRFEEGIDRGDDEGTWYARFEAERENIRAALRHSLRPGADRDPGMAIVARMIGAWYAQGAHDEALRWIDLALSLPSESPHHIQVVCNGGWFAHLSGDLARAERYYRAVLELAPRVGRPDKLLDVAELGRIARDRGEEAAALGFYAETLRLVDEATTPDAARAAYLWQAAECHRWFGRAREAESLARRALEHARSLGLQQAVAASLTTLAETARSRGDLDGAARLLDEASSVALAMGHKVWLRNVLTSQILFACDAGDHARASELCAQSVRVAREAGDRTAVAARWIDALALTAHGLGQLDAAARFFGHADALRGAVGLAVPPSDRTARERARAAVAAALGRRAEHGAPVGSTATVFTLAEQVFAPAQAAAVALSRREREVASLVVRGLSNRAIADRLVLGERTVETHVARLLRKLDVRTRHDVASRAQDLSLSL